MNMLDHGVLNVPLSKRGNIDAQLDKYKAKQASLEKDKSDLAKSVFADNKEIAQELWSKVDKELIKLDAKRRGMRFSELRDISHELVKWQPQKAIKVIPDYIK